MAKSEADSFSLSTATTMTDDPEAASPGVKKTRSRLRLPFNLAILVHFSSISITVTLLAVYIKDVTWNPSPNEINTLLIAAKAHELLIQASLATILLHRIRACLRGSQGVPLGFLSAPFALNSVYYLFSKQFWKAATRSKSKARGDITTRILVVSIIFLALAAGPSAGILMLPKLGWWEVTDMEGIGKVSEDLGRTILIKPVVSGGNGAEITMDDVYPQEIDFDREDGPCSSSSPTADSACPWTAASQILKKLPLVTAPKIHGKYNLNLTINGAQHQRDISVEWDDKGGTAAMVYATSPMDIIAREMQLLGDRVWPDPMRGIKIAVEAMEFGTRQAQIGTVNDQPVYGTAVYGKKDLWQQPALAVQCMPCREDETHYLADGWWQAPFASLAPTSGRTFALAKNSFTSQSPDSGSPLVLGVPHPGLSTALVWPPPDDKSPPTLCLVFAKWTKASIFISKPNDRTATTNCSTEPSQIFLSNRYTTETPITLSPSFSIAALNTNTNTTTPLCPPANPRCLPITLSLLLTDALSRTLNTASLSTCLVPTTPPKLPTNPLPAAPSLSCTPQQTPNNPPAFTLPTDRHILPYLALEVTYSSWQYAYRIHGAAEATAWILLTLHAVLVLVHLTEHGVRKRTYAMGTRGQGGGWDEVGELVAVALRMAYLWESGRDPELSTIYGRMYK
ncbi:hypothetical protein QBC39DRAFT_406829 [Podospora conica]|nr:hypothetical protein QBC39DRAFT_406829 [Schizothecium conicum]